MDHQQMGLRRSSRLKKKKQQQPQRQKQGELDENASDIQYAIPWNPKANKTKKTIMNNDELLKIAENKVFNESKSYRVLEKEDKERRNVHSMNAFKLKIEKTEKKRKEKEAKQQREIDVFLKYKDIDFYQSKSDLLRGLSDAMHEVRNKYKCKLEFMLNRLRFFKYCLNETDIILSSYNKNYEQIEKEVFRFCKVHKIWRDPNGYKQKQQIVWETLNESISLFVIDSNATLMPLNINNEQESKIDIEQNESDAHFGSNDTDSNERNSNDDDNDDDDELNDIHIESTINSVCNSPNPPKHLINRAISGIWLTCVENGCDLHWECDEISLVPQDERIKICSRCKQ